MQRLSAARADFAGLWSKARTWAVLCCGLGAMACAAADIPVLDAQQDPEYNSSFTLDFGAYGMRTANITTTHYTLATDPVGHTAQFLTYHQTVDPLELPGGVSTGNITVTIQESQPGTYDPGTGVFTTHDTYLIYFDGNLSMFGLTSPVALPGSAGGTITYDTPISGRIASAWTGQGELQNPYDPLHPIAFSYDCATHTTFSIVPEPAALALAGLLAVAARRRR